MPNESTYRCGIDEQSICFEDETAKACLVGPLSRYPAALPNLVELMSQVYGYIATDHRVGALMKDEIPMEIIRNIVEAMANRGFGPAGDENQQSYGRESFCLRKKFQDQLGIVFAVALIQRVKDKDQRLQVGRCIV